MSEELKSPLHKISLVPSIEIYKYIQNKIVSKQKKKRIEKKSKKLEKPTRKSQRVLNRIAPQIENDDHLDNKEEKDDPKSISEASFKLNKPKNYFLDSNAKRNLAICLEIAESLPILPDSARLVSPSNFVEQPKYYLRNEYFTPFIDTLSSRILVL